MFSGDGARRPFLSRCNYNFLWYNMAEELNEEELQAKVNEIYTPLSVAKEEIWRRWNDKELRKKVEEFLGDDLPDIFSDGPKVVIFRNIATPNFELKLAFDYAKMIGLDLAVIEFTVDRFCTRNRDKLHLGKLFFLDIKKKGCEVKAKVNIIPIKEVDNVPLRDIKTNWGEDLVAFHHRILGKNGYANVRTFDASTYKLNGLGPFEMYLKILGFCSNFSILLENFLVKTDKGERSFTERIIFPAFRKVRQAVRKKPMIVPLMGVNDEENVFWQYYSSDVGDLLLGDGQ